MGIEQLEKCCELVVNFLQRLDRMAQLAEGGIKAGGQLVSVHGSIFVIVVIDDERGHKASRVGMRESIGGRGLEFLVKGIPFLEKRGGQCHVLSLVLFKEGVIIVVE